MRFAACMAVAACALCTLAGCGTDNGLTMGRVSGLVSFKGDPVEFGDILFVPDGSKGNKGVPAMGKIGKDGRYVMSTQESGDGVIAGFHKVGVRVLDPEPVSKADAPEVDVNAPAGQDGMKGRIQQRKAMAQSLRKNRAKQDAPTVTFNGKAYRFLVDKKMADPETSGISVEISTGSNRVDFAFNDDGTVKINK
jgi:hypothetical protein